MHGQPENALLIVSAGCRPQAHLLSIQSDHAAHQRWVHGQKVWVREVSHRQSARARRTLSAAPCSLTRPPLSRHSSNNRLTNADPEPHTPRRSRTHTLARTMYHASPTLLMSAAHRPQARMFAAMLRTAGAVAGWPPQGRTRCWRHTWHSTPKVVKPSATSKLPRPWRTQLI